MILRPDLTLRAQQLAQDPLANGAGPGLLTGPNTYSLLVDSGLQLFAIDRPNERILDYTVLSSGFRLVLAGTGAILTGVNAWDVDGSVLRELYLPWSATNQGAVPLDENTWRVLREPSATVLELLGTSAGIGDVVRLVYTTPYVVHETDIALTSLTSADIQPVATLIAYLICRLASVRYAQNTGSSSLPNDIVDRRSQSDIMASRAKDLRAIYDALVGRGGGESGSVASSGVPPASAIRDLDVTMTSHGLGMLYHPSGAR